MNTEEKNKNVMPSPGDIIELEVTDLAVEGGGVAKADGVVFFLDKGLPGDKVQVRVHTVKTRFAEARVESVLSASPDTVEPFCRYFGKCGGCTWQNLSYTSQLAWKSRHIKETLIRLGKVKNVAGVEALEHVQILPSPETSGYRNKMEYAFSSSGSGDLVLGLRRRGSQQIENIEHCPLQSETSGQIISTVHKWAISNHLEAWDGKEGHLRFLIIREPKLLKDGKAQRIVELISSAKFADAPANRAKVQDLIKEIQMLGVTSFVHSARGGRTDVAIGERIISSHGPVMLEENIGGLELSVPVSGFMQTNTGAASALTQAVKNMVAELEAKTGKSMGLIWDLYSGSGLFALHLSGTAEKILGFEQDKSAVKAARHNTKTLGIVNCGFYDGDALEKAKQAQTNPDLVLLDPPRGGIDPSLPAILKKKKPEHIIYISCAPATLARDIAMFAPEYELVKAAGADMFPHTPHVECVVMLARSVGR